MQHQIDVIFLEKCLQKDLIPRGLRITLGPTFSDDEQFVKCWLEVLDNIVWISSSY